MTKDERYNRRRCLQVGNKLVEGPLALFPPESEDEFGWLECDFRITKYAPDYSIQESLAIYTDDTMNREEGFLKPVLRSCVWQRKNDIQGANVWPSTDIRIGHIGNLSKIRELIVHLQTSLSKVNFGILGLSLARDTAEVECNYKEVSFDIYLRNGVQAIKYSSCYINGDEYSDLVLSSYQKLFDEIVVFEKEGWKEQYEYDLNKESPKEMWEWQYFA